MSSKSIVLIVFCLLSLGFVLLGLFDRNVVLNANPCKMTYTSKEKSIVKFETNSTNKLWKISNPKSSKLNLQPVLFIPGHYGSVDQARSLASHMHNNKDYFQHFSLDFNGQDSAFHGSDVISQAAYTNEALEKIATLYNITSRGVSSKGLKIMIVAHSLGGMVARTAATLSNHPKCVVSDIIMLSSPNNKSPYTPDASMDKLFSSVNRAWLLSFYNTSKACQTSAVMAGLSGVYDQHSALSADYLCPVCAPQIRLTSISGGDIDLHVSPALTQLHEIASRPRNTSLEVVKQKGGMGVLGRVTQVKGLVTGLLSSVTVGVVKSVSGLFTSSNTTGVSEVVDEEVGVDTQCDAAFDGSCPVVVESDTNNTNANTTTYTRDITSKDKTEKEKTQFDFITPANWEAHILPYIEPQFLSVRTSQLKGVGFPIDHTAMLWCFELLQVVTRGMETLSRVDSGDLSFDFANAFPVAGSSQSIVDSAVQAVKIINIDQLSRFVSRNESLHAFNLARVDESAYVVKILGGSALRALTVTYVTRHLVQIAVCYLIVSVLIIASGLLRVLAGHVAPSPIVTLSNLTFIHPWYHWSFDLLYPALLNALQQSGLPVNAITALLTLVSRTIPVVVLVKVAIDWYFTSHFVATYSNILFWFVSYGLSLVLRAVLLTVIFALRFIVSGIYTVIRTTLRMTIWNAYIRRNVRKVFKIPALKNTITTLRVSFAPLILVSFWVFIYLKTSDRMSTLGSTTYGLSLITIVAYIAVIIGVICAILSCPYDNKIDTQIYTFYTDCVLLYFSVPMLAYPSFIFAVRLLYGEVSQYHSVANLYGIFGPERIHYCLSLIFVALHLWRIRNRENTPSVVTPLTFLEDSLGPRALLTATNITSSGGGSDGSASSSGNMFSAFHMSNIRSSTVTTCMHEDGGKYAVFEQIEATEAVTQVAKGVCLGPTYRVVHCACAKDVKLKFQSEWCEWCLCRKCGGKHLPVEKDVSRADTKDFSADLLLLAAFYGIVGITWMYALDRPYLCLYFIGLVAVAHFVVSLSKMMKIGV